MRNRKRLIIAAVLGITAFVTAFAAAASLTVTSNTLGAGTGTVASCDAGVTTSFDTAYSSTVAGYKVTVVHVDGLATPACDGKAIKVTLVGGSDVSLSELTATLATPAADPALDFTSANVAASAVVKVAVVVSG